jgi:hypothetical protein
MEPSVNTSGPSDESLRFLSVEDRIDRLESQVWELRSLLRAAEVGTHGQKASQANKSQLAKTSPDSKTSASLALDSFLSPINSFFRNWILIPLGIIQSISWLRRMFILALGAAILLSNWWLPLTSFWILGGIFERLVILVLAGIWWYLIAGAWSPFFRDKKRNLTKAGSNGWFGSRAS